MTKARIPQTLGTLFVLLIAGFAAAQQPPAQPPAGRGPAGAPQPQNQNRNGIHVYLWAGLKSHG